MRKACLFLVAACLLFCSFALQEQNPLLGEFDTPFNVPPFERIKVEHYKPAFEEGMKRQLETIDAIVNDKAPATFENTIEALEGSAALLTKAGNIFRNMNSANTSEELQEIAKEILPMLSEHADRIRFNEKLFERVKAVYELKEDLDLTPEQGKLLEETYKFFVRGGANLDGAKKAELAGINKELSVLRLKFGENILKEINTFELVIEKEGDLAGLPEAAVTGAAEAAEERGREGKWVFTLHKPSMIPFLQYSEKRVLREKIFKAYTTLCNKNDELDNKKTLSRMAALRARKAGLLGYETHAHFVLEENMAKSPDKVYGLLGKLWKPALAKAKKEAAALQELIYKEGGDFELEPWDWWYYAEKLKKAQFELDDETLRPYFELENVRNGAFTVANKLYGITFEEIIDIPKYNEDIRVFEVKEADGAHIGILYTDYYPRASKRGGAWMSSYRKQSGREGKRTAPVITNVGNFSKPTGGKPALLSFDEVTTLFYEFGHALHGLLSDCTYETLSGTAVAQDFVELPSQIMENWLTEPEVLRIYARHYETGKRIPQELIERLKRSRHFNQGFATTEYLAASILDMDWHTMTDAGKPDPEAFEAGSMKRIGMIPEIVVRYRSTYFRHIFSGDYSAGYYSYIWAEVLDADAFRAFKENGLFDRETAEAFRHNILAAGGTGDPMTLYVRFRGAEPGIDALLEKRGLK